jgi:hypothetical protein
MKITRLLLVLCLAAVTCLAATTEVADTIKYADGTTANGYLVIEWPSFTNAGGILIGAGKKKVKFTAGTFTVNLEPNDTAVPSGTSYLVRYHLRKGDDQLEYWVVPTSGSPVTIGCTAKGSLLAANGSSLTCFAVGTDGKFLKANSGQSSGVEWADAMLNPMTTLGDVIYGGASGAATRLAGNITTTKKFFNQTGTGSASAAPSWDALIDDDVPDTITLTNITQISTRSHTSLTDIGSNAHSVIDTHLGSTSNPHSVTATQLGAVEGRANLTTVGRIPFVSAAGTVTEDANLFWDNTDKRLGIGATPSYVLHVAETSTAASGEFDARSFITLNPGASSSAVGRGFYGIAQSASGGANFTANQPLRGIEGKADYSSAGTISGAVGVFGTVNEGGAGTITNAYSLYASAPTGSITNKYGLYIPSITGGASSNWAIYAAGGASYFGGDVTQSGSTLAALGTPPDGTTRYCSDCAKDSDPCAGSSNGAMAHRLNSAWVCTGGSGGGTHDILSATHTDTTAASVTRGGLMVGKNVTPKWELLTIGGANTVLGSDGTDATWGAVPDAALSANVVLENASNTWSTGTQDMSGATATLPLKATATPPVSCTANEEMFIDTDATPAGEQVFICNATGDGWNKVGDGGGGGGGVANHETTFTSQTSVTVTGATHGFAHRKILVDCKDNSSPRKVIEPQNVTIDNSTYNVVITFAVATTGVCHLNGSGGAGTVTNAAALTADMPMFGDGANAAKVGTKTGTGNEAVMSQSPTIVTPTIASLTNAQHGHTDAAGGGSISATYQVISEKNAVSGYAGLDGSTKLTQAQGQEVWALADLSDVASVRGNSTQVQLTTGTTSTDDCAKFDANGNLVTHGGACGGGGSHEILSATHTDTTAASVVRGDLMTGQLATPKWQRLAKGTQYQVLLGGATDLAWGAVSLDQGTAVTGILGSANGGTGNGFTLFSGPTTSEKTFTLPDASATIEYQANKDSASGYAGLTAGTKLALAQGQEVWGVADLSDFASKSGSGTAALGATITTPNDNDYPKYSSGDWINSTLPAAGTGTCTNQVATALNADAAPTCTTLTLASAYFANQGTTTTVLHGNASGNPAFGAVVAEDVQSELRTEMKSIVILDPTTTQTNMAQLKFSYPVTIQRVSCSTDVATSTVTIQLDERAEGTPNTSGTDVMTSTLVCDTDTQATTSFTNAGIAADAPLNLQITATANSPTAVRIHIDYQID